MELAGGHFFGLFLTVGNAPAFLSVSPNHNCALDFIPVLSKILLIVILTVEIET